MEKLDVLLVGYCNFTVFATEEDLVLSNSNCFNKTGVSKLFDYIDLCITPKVNVSIHISSHCGGSIKYNAVNHLGVRAKIALL